ncbi:hypothetical protein BDZ97DRAFT_1931899 [Flammula alnicola]|nr:hypothetical protein BDZ97DRAFT_1931899 [Flammula alnicola]
MASPLHTPSFFKLEDHLVQHMDADLTLSDISDLSDLDEDDPPPSLPLIAPQAPAPTPSTIAAPIRPPGMKDRAWKNVRQREERRKKRAAIQELSGSRLKACTAKYRPIASANPLHPAIDMEKDFKTTKPAWVGLRDGKEEWRDWSTDELKQKFSMNEVEWTGRDSRIIVSNNRVIGLLAGTPKCIDWGKVNLDASSAIHFARQQLAPPEHTIHRRGAFPAYQIGLSHGGGQASPRMRLNSPACTPILNELLQQPAFKRIVGFTNSAFETVAPRLYNYYQDTIDELVRWSPDTICRTFPKSAFASATINFGPRTVSFPHRDYANLTWGWCAITALGSFNPDRGGHLVLWDLKYIIRFPPGSTILIPSAMIRHSNTPIANNETRYSFAQYSAGGLFRWVDNGCQKQADWEANASEEEKAQRMHDQSTRWIRGLEMLSTIEELQA